jgi:hypothetical protein
MEMTMVEWPRTLRNRKTASTEVSDETFAVAVQSAVAKRGKDFSSIVDVLQEACRAGADPKETVSRLFALSGKVSDEHSDVIPALVCVEALRQMPSADTWIFLWSLAWHSSPLEYILPRTVMTIAKEDPPFKSLFLEIAAGVIREMVANPGRRAIPGDRQLFSQLRDTWREKSSLDNIWWGLREGGHMLFRDDDGVFRIVANLDPKAFIELLSMFDNPYPIPSALESAKAGWSFDHWKTLFSLAPLAFNENGTWNGSPIVPLLLVIARDQILEAQFRIGPQSSEDDLKDAATQIGTLAGEIAKAVAGRPDASPCAERWAAWLMRQCLQGVANDTPPYPANARSHGYVDSVLIVALGNELRGAEWNPSSPVDAERWEPWCYRCVLVIIAAEGAIRMPGADEFLGEWEIDPEDWVAQRGHELREKSSLFDVFGKRADAYGTRLLAIPLAEAHEAVQKWRHLWGMTQTIREIVEFGDHDEEEDVGSLGGIEAAQLMRLVFGLGLMMLDCIVDPARNVQGDRQSSLEELCRILLNAANEMAAIDRMNYLYWREANRHLAARCAVWRDPVSLAAAFNEHSKPSFSDFVKDLSDDTENLLALIEVTLRNGVEKEFVRKALKESNTDLATHIAFADKLISLDNRRAGIGPEQLNAAKSLL